MDRSLQRLGPFFVRMEQVLRDYGLDFDAALKGMRVSLVEQTGDQAKVRLQYTLAGRGRSTPSSCSNAATAAGT